MSDAIIGPNPCQECGGDYGEHIEGCRLNRYAGARTSTEPTATVPDAPDTRGPAIIVTGGVIEGFHFYGPFESIDYALKWYELSLFGQIKVPVTIALLENPAK